MEGTIKRLIRKNNLLVFLIILLSALLIIICYFPKRVEYFDELPFLNKIDSLENVIDNFEQKRDSIKIVRDTIILQIKDNNKHYEEVRNNVINNTVIEDLEFFSEYIRKQQDRFSINNI